MGMTNKQFEAFLRAHLGRLKDGIKDAKKDGSLEKLEELAAEIEEVLKRP